MRASSHPPIDAHDNTWSHGVTVAAKLSPQQRRKVATTVKEFYAGDLRSSSGEVVTSLDQALAIGHSKARHHKSTRRRRP